MHVEVSLANVGKANAVERHARRLFVEASRNSRQRFIDYLIAAQKAKLVRKEIDPVIAADTFAGMMMAGALRRPLIESFYPVERYFETCVDIFLKGIEK